MMSRVELEAGRTAAVLEVAGPGQVDLVAGEAGPLAGGPLAEAGIHHHRSDAQHPGDHLGGDPRPLQVAGHHRVDGADGGSGGGRLRHPERRQRGIGVALPPSLGVPLGLAVAGQQHLGGLGGHGPAPYRRVGP